MKQTTFQHPELRDANDNIIQQGAFGKNTALANATNDGWIDYVANDLEALYDSINGGTGGEINTETITGKTGTITNLTATTVKAGTLTADALNGPLTGNVTGTADKAVADGDGNNIVNTYVTKSAVQGELTNYLPLSGGTVTGDLTVTGTLDGTASGNLPLSGGSITGNVDITRDLFVGGNLVLTGNYVENGKVFSIGNTDPGNVDLGWNWANGEGAGIGLRSVDHLKTPGEFFLYARDSANSCSLEGKPDGSLTWKGQPLLPVGIVQAFAGTTIPSGWLLCDGSAVSRTTYASLYACIGTTYGSGNGSTTFNLPNLIDKFVEGSATAGTVKNAGLPNITGDLGTIRFMNTTVTGSGALFSATTGSTAVSSSGSGQTTHNTINFDASRSSSIYGNSTTVQPPTLTMRYIIKY